MAAILPHEYEEACDLFQTMSTALFELENILKAAMPNKYQEWKQYGKHVTDEFVIMGPNLPEIMELLEAEVRDPDDEDVDE